MLQEFLNNDNLVKALMFDVPDFLSKSIPSDFDRTSLLYDRVWPFRYIPEIQDDKKSLITTHWHFQAYDRGDTYKIAGVTFFVIVHFDLIRIDDGLRTDFLIAEIEHSRKRSSLIGTSKLKFQDMEDFVADTGGKWLGTRIKYRAIKVGAT